MTHSVKSHEPLRAGGRDKWAGWRYRGNIALRALAGTFGAYGVAALWAFTLARLLPMPRVEAIVPAILSAYLVLPAVSIYAFLARSAARAWFAIALVALLLGGMAFLAGPHLS